MRRTPLTPLLLAGLLAAGAARAAPPVLDGLVFAQRVDGSGLVDIHFDLADADGDALTVRVQASADGGVTWLLACASLTGDVGPGVPAEPGRHIVWDAGADLPGVELDGLRLRLLVSDEALPLDMLRIPAGRFAMGVDGDRDVTLSRDYLLGRREVSNAEYLAALEWAVAHGEAIVVSRRILDPGGALVLINLADPATEIRHDPLSGEFGLGPAAGAEAAYPEGYDPAAHPVKALSWHAAAFYCNWRSAMEGLPPVYDPTDWSVIGGDPHVAAGYRLPTEAEWEFAARLDGGALYPWGDAVPDCARANGAGCLGWSEPGGSHGSGAAPLGLLDMSGNVAEWCQDWDDPLPPGDWLDPLGPVDGERRVSRGGGFDADAAALQAVARDAATPSTRSATRGFRCARSCANSHPRPPQLLQPADAGILFTSEVELIWSGGDPDGDALVYDLYLDGALLAAELADSSYQLAGLELESTHTWRVLARDALGFEQWSPLQRFELWSVLEGEGLRFDFDLPYFEGGEGELIADHSVVFDGGDYHCFHIYQHPGGGPEQLGHLVSPDLRRWVRRPDILPVAEGEDWEAWGIWAPQVIPNPLPGGAAWLMLYTGVAGLGRPQQTGLAFSEDLDTWWRADADHEGLNPFYHPTADWAAWDDDPESPDWSAPSRDPFAFRWEGRWHLLTTGADSLDLGLITHAVGPADSFDFLGHDADEPLLLRADPHHPESVQLLPVQHADGALRWHLFYSGLDGTRHQAADSLDGGAGGWDGGAQVGDQLGGYGWTGAEVTDLEGRWVFSQHRRSATTGNYLLRFGELDFDAEPDGAPRFAFAEGVAGIRGSREDGRIEEDLTWQIVGDLQGHAFEGQPTWGDNPLHDPARGESSGMSGNAYLATYERRPSPDSAPGVHFATFERTGWIRSAAFQLRRNRLRLDVGGGSDPAREFVALVDAASDSVLFLATGEDSHTMSERVWDCETLRGRWVYLVAADLSADDWGCIALDAVVAVEDAAGALPGEPPLVGGPGLAELTEAP